ncbi:Peptidyl-tRNA hydrolase 2 [uncultured virus]|nr:Peptidyl-tRNA hydrolase 2 [uncultured virus]
MYIVVNNSVKMDKGKIAAQVGHAVMMATEYMIQIDDHLYRKYKQGGMTKIVLKADKETIDDLEARFTNIFVVRDAGRTQIAAGTLTAIAFLPMTENQRDGRYGTLSKLKLL